MMVSRVLTCCEGSLPRKLDEPITYFLSRRPPYFVLDETAMFCGISLMYDIFSCHDVCDDDSPFKMISKATLDHVRASKGAYIHVSATLHYKGQ